MKNVLVLAAHPDDETFGCGATIARLSREGHKVHLLTFTDGISARAWMTPAAQNRNYKLKAVAKHLGIHTHKYGSFPDNQMDSVPLLEVCRFIENNINFKPDIIFTHHPDCLNVDHVVVYKAAITVFRPQEGDHTQIYSYYIPSSTEYNPLNSFRGNVYFDVEKYKDKKIKCLKECYEEEMRGNPHARSYQNIENTMKFWGSEVGLKYAEKFQLIREIK